MLDSEHVQLQVLDLFPRGFRGAGSCFQASGYLDSAGVMLISLTPACWETLPRDWVTDFRLFDRVLLSRYRVKVAKVSSRSWAK